MLSVNEIQTPAYICDIDAFKGNITDFREAVKKYYPKYSMGYSFKTNYYSGFCKAVEELGEYAEVVSPMELDYAINDLGFDYGKVIYNGIIKDVKGKVKVALNGGLANIDNLDEFKAISDYCRLHSIFISVGLRVNFDIGSGVVSRFGVDVTGNDYEWIKNQDNHPNVRVKAIHCHFSQARSLEYFKRRVHGAAKIAKEFGANIVDIGGNMFGRMDEQFLKQFPEHVPTFEEYAEAIGTAMLEEFPDGNAILVTEDGTPMVSNAMHILTSITGVRDIRGNKFITVDTKREEVGASCITKSPSFMHFGQKEDWYDDATVFGCTCVEIDYILRKYSGYARIGDKLLLKNIGAYSYNTTNEFITPLLRKVVQKNEIKELKNM